MITKPSSPERDSHGEEGVVAHKVGESDKNQITQVMAKSSYFIQSAITNQSSNRIKQQFFFFIFENISPIQLQCQVPALFSTTPFSTTAHSPQYSSLCPRGELQQGQRCQSGHLACQGSHEKLTRVLDSVSLPPSPFPVVNSMRALFSSRVQVS